MTEVLADADGAVSELRAWLRQNLPAGWLDAIDGQDELALAPLRAELEANLNAWLDHLSSAGYTAAGWPPAYGGLGLTAEQTDAVQAELDRYQVPQNSDFVGRNLAGPLLLAFGTEGQKARYLPGIVRARQRWCQLFSEPSAGSDLAGLSTRAVSCGDDWMVQGQKVWTSHAQVADFGLLLARTAPERLKRQGITCFIVDMRAVGVGVRPLRQMTGEAKFNEVFLDGVRISDGQRLGPIDEGWRVAATALAHERSKLSVPTIGKAGVAELIARARRAGRWNDPVCRDELITLWIRERVLRLTAARAAERVADPGAIASITKLVQSRLEQDVTEADLALSGTRGIAWLSDSAADRSRADGFLGARATTLAGGTSEIQRTIIGERLLGLPREPDPYRGTPWRDIPRSSG